MSRPKPNILLEKVNKQTYITDQVLEADAIYAVFYNGKPINLRSKHALKDDPSKTKYKKVSFSNPGHAHNMAQKLNSQFNTDKFEVYRLTDGEKVVEE